MPFDGLGYVSTTTNTTAKLSIWTRLTQFALGTPPVTKTIPLHAFQPVPAGQPDAVTLQVLTIGRALIEDRKDWVQRRYETRDGRRCAVGALRGAARLMNLHGPQSGANTILLSVAMSRGFNDIESMNDNSSHRQVVSAFDEAISRARQYTG
ncbi:MAG: hypothetical protein QOD93_1325 [Acetobacteraceae bacterium]|jgi:hypothetical protein|nr:hypothetical protein [Rhodopila sp.]MEA2729226.1 hypothetical protein [Acetobacteraceae bacterium]MEA2768363.1 hypothetical protein [Acetobacteraceae bacterium]